MSIQDPYQPRPATTVRHPEWSKKAVIYQINTRQFTPEGTFRAAEAHLPRLQALGVDILWLMPIHPIGRRKRKGTLGSPYAVADYYGVNPEFGTLDDLRCFVDAAHALGLYVIIGWVPNHSAWDCNLVDQHPEWYARDWKGDLRPTPWCDWSDVVDFDYSQPGLRRYMTAAMKYWVADVGVDGFRCDVAGFVPTDFWDQVRVELEAVKPVILLAEWESRDLHVAAFDMTYAWRWNHTLHDIAMGRADASALYVNYAWNEKTYPRDALRMTFVSNHDKNAWEGTQFEQFGDALEAAITLSVVGEGLPLIYNGQEAGNPRRLAFFEKDAIDWRPHPIGDLYRRLIRLKKENSALWNGAWGARMVQVDNSAATHVLSFVRRQADSAVFAVFNLSPKPRTVTFGEGPHHGRYVEFFSGAAATVNAATTLQLAPWEARVYVAGGTGQ